MKWPKIKRKHSLLLWIFICLLGLLGNCFMLEEYLEKKDYFRVYIRIFWILSFGITAILTVNKYRKEISNDEAVKS